MKDVISKAWDTLSWKNHSKINTLLNSFQGEGLTPDEIQQLQQVNVKGSLNYSALLFSVYLLTDAARRGFPQFDPFMGIELPDVLHNFLQAVHNVTVNSADSQLLKDHFPFILLALSPISAIGEFLNSQGLRKRLESTKDDVVRLLDEGQMNYVLREGHAAVFSGNGDFLADQLQKTLPPDQAMYYSTDKPDDEIPVWQYLDTDKGYQEFKKRLEEGGFDNAGEAIFFPVKQSEMFLPSGTQNSFDISLPELRSYIAMIDTYCQEKNIPLKRIVIVGSTSLKQEYKSSQGDSHTNTLKSYIDSLREDGRAIEIIDPTQMVIEELISRYPSSHFSFNASTEDFEKYSGSFLDAIADQLGEDTVGNGENTIDVHYNTADTFSINNDDSESNKQTILIITDPSKYELAVMQVGAENVIFVPEVVNKKLHELTNETLTIG